MCFADRHPQTKVALVAWALLHIAGCSAEPAPPSPAMELCPSGRVDEPDIPIAVKSPANATTYYVRADGGNEHECTGRVDAAYPGRGGNQPCAWNSPEAALPASGPPHIARGDILLIGPGTYRIGTAGHLQPIPSGRDPTSPTRILGKTGAVPKLVGINGIHRVLNLDGSSNVEIGNLEITDDSDCVFRHSQAGVACDDSMPWARVGLYARASSNVWVHDVDIHGMAARGINAGGLRDWTVERVKLNRNGSAGWDGNIGADGSDSGEMILRDVEIGWNGCGERVATGEPWACWAQKTGGYGDGLGTTNTGGQWLIEDAYVHHNTSDGLDLRYMDGADATHVTLRRVHAMANAGNQVKVKGNSLIENSELVGSCSFFRGKFFMTQGDLCRADGSTLQLVMTGNDVAIVRHNTIAGEGAVQIGHSEGDSSDRILIENNVVVGFPYYFRPSTASAFDGGNSRASRKLAGNVGWRVRDCPDDTDCRAAPRLEDMRLTSFKAKPIRGAAVHAGIVSCGREDH